MKRPKQKRKQPFLAFVFLTFVVIGTGFYLVHNRPTSVSAETTKHIVVALKSYPEGTSTVGGTIVSSPAGISCPGDCEEDFPADTKLTFTAIPSDSSRRLLYFDPYVPCENLDTYPSELYYSGYHFQPTCDIDLSKHYYFNLQVVWGWTNYTYPIQIKGSGQGKVYGGGISCTSSCSPSVPAFTYVTLTAEALPGSRFVGWGPAAGYDRAKCSNHFTPGWQSRPVIVDVPTCERFVDEWVNPMPPVVAYFEKATAATAQTAPAVTSSQPANEQAKPSSEQLLATNTVKVNNESVAGLASKNVVYAQGDPIALSGKTIKNGIVTVYVFSEPKKYTVTANEAGEWSYVVGNLPAGEHHIEYEVTDPATSTTSERHSLLAFHVADASASRKTASIPTQVYRQYAAYWAYIVAGVGAVLAFGVYILISKKRRAMAAEFVKKPFVHKQ